MNGVIPNIWCSRIGGSSMQVSPSLTVNNSFKSTSEFSWDKIVTNDAGHFPLTKCLYPQYVPWVTSRLNKKRFDIDLHQLLKILNQPGTLYKFLNRANLPNGNYFTISQSLNGEHLFMGAPASLWYSLTKSPPDPWINCAVNREGASLRQSQSKLEPKPKWNLSESKTSVKYV